MSQITCGDFITLSIRDFAQGGYGISDLPDGRTALVDGAIPGETVCAVIEDIKKDYVMCRTAEVLVPSDKRTEPPCPYYHGELSCGGCSLMHISYHAQLELKNNLFSSAIKQVCGDGDIDLLPPAYSTDAGYRSRAKFIYSVSGKQAELGFLKKQSSEAVFIKSCFVCNSKLNTFISSPPLLNKWELENSQLPCISTDSKVLYHPSEPDFITVSSQIAGSRRLWLSNQVFFQSNLLLLPELIDFIFQSIQGERVLDLYSGVGTFSAFLEDRYCVTAVEMNKDCLMLAKRNLHKTKFITSPVQNLSLKSFSCDTVIVDPPRTGLAPNVPSVISSLHPETVIYVSCYLPTLIRDIRKFISLGYAPTLARMLDFYPHTPHLETVVLMSQNK